eukprot:Clim_evm4s90 gene=Clim_evmTU4s90
MADLNAIIKGKIESNKVMIFSKSYCPFCKKVKALFDQLGVAYGVVEMDQEPEGTEMQNELERISGQRTVPNVYIKGQHIGGCDDTMALNNSGKLKELVA